MQPTRNTPSENTRAQASGSGDGSERTRVTTCVSAQPSTLAGAPRATLERHDLIEIWVNEEGTEGEVNR